MTRVIFYVNVADCDDFLCRFLHRKVFLPRQRALIYATEPDIARLDDRLWESAFLPHQHLTAEATPAQLGTTPQATPAAAVSPAEPITPIMLTATAPPPDYTCDILVSLTAKQPLFAASFPVLVDIVDNSEASKQSGRVRYRYFQDHGYSVDLIDMAKK